ncbi:MAG: uracil-DNA glycosylase [Candidatus Omnitrophica bacterium]|nr:uracil-DNA glycosylase [Candidatus Omnitrophota bacterium]
MDSRSAKSLEFRTVTAEMRRRVQAAGWLTDELPAQSAGNASETQPRPRPAQRSRSAACGQCPAAYRPSAGEGGCRAVVFFIGDAPAGEGADRPISGPAGILLDQIIHAGMGLSRDEVYIMNAVACPPPQAGLPAPAQIAACRSALCAAINLNRPKVICTLGACATAALLGQDTVWTRVRGVWQEYAGIPVMPTDHPAYLAEHPAEKKIAWQDIQEILRRLGREIPSRGKR